MKNPTAVIKKLSPPSLLCGLCLLLATPSPLMAAPLLLGGTLFPAPPEPDPTGGVVVAGGFPIPFASGAFSGTLTSTAITGDPSNPFGGLTFTYLLVNSASSLDSIDRLTISDFSGFSVDASYQIPLAGLPPALINRSLAGDTVGFSFFAIPPSGELTPGAGSALLVLQTSATAFAPTFASVINSTTASVASLAPAAVPEPSSLAFFGLGLFGLAACLRFRRCRS
jgi:hypothetical protein